MRQALTMLKGTEYKALRPIQIEALAMSADSLEGNVFEAPTGSGKTLIGIVDCLRQEETGRETYYVTPNKTQVGQIGEMFPDQTSVAFGRAEYRCLYYRDRTEEYVNAQESPCRMLCRAKKCPHEVDQVTGKTVREDADPCPYYLAKFRALAGQRRGRVTVCTTAFFLANRLMQRFSAEVGEEEENEGISVVFDEAHNLAKIARGLHEFTLSDFHLEKAETALRAFAADQAKIVRRFRLLFMRIARQKQPSTKRHKEYQLLEDADIDRLMTLLQEFNRGQVEQAVGKAMSSGKLSPTANREEIKLLEDLIRNIPAFSRSLKYSLPDKSNPDRPRGALNYVVAFHYKKMEDDGESSKRKARHFLTIKAYYVAPLIKRAIGENGRVEAMSATIGNPNIFGHETGFRMPFKSFASPFDAANTRVIMPRDTPDLSGKAIQRRNDAPKKALRMVLDGVERCLEHGHRSLIVTASDEERLRYMKAAVDRGLYALTYGDGVSARAVASAFRDGEGQLLIGTEAQFGEGLDLPNGLCQFIWFTRPGYPRPDDPMSQFEQKRFTQSHCWALWQYRVMIKALQVRGRNIRTAEDRGACIFVSQQFRNFLYGSLPEWLRPSFIGIKTLDQALDETLKMMAEPAAT